MNAVVSRSYIFFFIAIIFIPLKIYAQNILPIEKSEESITYWKTFEILPDEDPKVRETHRIFERLLLGWEETRIAPTLHVVRSDKGPWAASLDDGTILLSRESIDICWRNSSKGEADRLAFVLAHELAHQRADHLWHRRFFRLAGQEPPRVRGRMLGGISMDQLEVVDLEAKEIQADREGLLLMAMVGFDPLAVAGEDSRFFFEWIESIWGESCKEGADDGDCAKARSRFDRARTNWQGVARQSILFDLGVQAYMAGEYEKARRFFTTYGREFPHREIHNNIGLTYIAQVLVSRKQLISKGVSAGPEFVYPFVFDEQPLAKFRKDGSRYTEGTRGGVDPETARLQKEIEKYLNEAALSFERAIKIDPAHRQSYWNLASTYLLSGNAPLAYGVIAGNYVKRFGEDSTSTMLLGISAYMDGQTEKARSLLEGAVSKATGQPALHARMNLAVYIGAAGDQEREQVEWKRLADMGRKTGDEDLFRIALKRMGREVETDSPSGVAGIEKIHDYRPGQRLTTVPADAMNSIGGEVWIEGERIQVYQFGYGAGMAVDSNRNVIALWQGEGNATTAKGIKIHDDAARLGRTYGVPTRRAETLRGDYRAYDDYQIAFRVIDEKIGGWFLYEK